ncbi:hypothetical protein SH661x_001099 [Planctomicrobium sp. SH661]|uniref:hypothetical protein n=1 Tax=Planctomicrobium sp. SH661 TaxID=3448124 RepID=UPI003F5B28F4
MAGRQLESDRIIETVEVLSRRIRERFPTAGLNGVCGDLLAIARQARQRSVAIGRPMIGIRLLSFAIVSLILLMFGLLLAKIRIPDQPLQAGEFIQGLEAGFNALVLIGATILFLFTLEVRVKRARALRAIHELRTIAHIIDMHQLTKDPERNFWKGKDTQSSPQRTMTPFELNRYLDYCSEMLALTGKIAALYVDNFPDAQAVAAVNDIEDLTSGLARKIWQKIMVLHNIPHDARIPTAATAGQGDSNSPEIS